MTLTRENLLDTWLREEQEPFEGWDFSHLHGRMIEDETPWSYEDRAAELMTQATALLDIDTGGGERLLAWQAQWPACVAVTEGYPPNIALARQRLAPLGVEVAAVDVEQDAIPFANGEFDLIINRHGALPVTEIARLLPAGGIFLTEQVSGMWGWDLVVAFDMEPDMDDDTPQYYVSQFEAAELTITHVADWRGKMRFTDVGAIVYYLTAIPWMAPGFSVQTHQKALFALQANLDAGHPLEFEIGAYMIEARKPRERDSRQEISGNRYNPVNPAVN